MDKIVIERPRLRLHVAITGFPTGEAVEALTARIREALPQFGDAIGRHTIFCDLSGSQVAPGDVVTLLFATLTNPAFAHLRARRLAFYTPSALSHLQVDRLRSARDGIRVFRDRGAALAWLDEPVEALPA